MKYREPFEVAINKYTCKKGAFFELSATEVVVTAGYDKDPNIDTDYILYPDRS